MDVLVALGTSARTLFSAVVTLLGPANEHVYFEAGAAVITLVLLGKLLEARARAGTSAALEGLLRLQPKMAHVERDGRVVDVPLSAVVARRSLRGARRRGHAGRRRRSRRRVERRREHADRRKPPGGESDRAIVSTPARSTQEGLLHGRATGVGASTLLAGIVRLVPRRRARRRRSSASPTACRGSSCRSCSRIAALTFAATWCDRGRRRARAGARGRGAGDRVSVRARARHADRDHRRHGPRARSSACWCATPPRWSGRRRSPTLVSTRPARSPKAGSRSRR